ncbi:MAG: hypothetical protein FWF50_00415, partial [Defluviitaleaceae bacterium]|nr:hypothetical protein [Defluviitaleaceae bacterium]
GNVIAYVYGHDGIINITTGQEHFGGEALAHNNLLLIPRHDARGIRILTDSWVMVRGNYFLR